MPPHYLFVYSTVKIIQPDLHRPLHSDKGIKRPTLNIASFITVSQWYVPWYLPRRKPYLYSHMFKHIFFYFLFVPQQDTKRFVLFLIIILIHELLCLSFSLSLCTSSSLLFTVVIISNCRHHNYQLCHHNLCHSYL